MSGSDDAADVAEMRKLQAQLREAKDGLSDTYYSHSKDSQSQALDNEFEAYQKSAEDYIESLREKLENVDAIIEQTLSDVLFNADVTFQNLVELSEIHGMTLSTNLVTPWQQMATQATTAKDQIGLDLLLLNEDHIAPFSEYAGTLITAPFTAGGAALTGFTTSVMTQILEIEMRISEASSNLSRDLIYPWDSTTSPIDTFSTNVENALTNAINKAESEADDMTSYLTNPWKSASDAVNMFGDNTVAGLDAAVGYAQGKVNEMTNALTSPWEDGSSAINTWSQAVVDALNTAISNINDAFNQVGSGSTLNLTLPNYGNSGGSYTYTPYVPETIEAPKTDTVKKIGTSGGVTYATYGGTIVANGTSYTKMNGVYYKTTDTGSVFDSSTSKTIYYVKNGATAYSINNSSQTKRFIIDNGAAPLQAGKTYKNSKASYMKDENTNTYYVDQYGNGSYWIQAGDKSAAESIVNKLKSSSGWTPSKQYSFYARLYAKGTLGTKKDEWAYTDEPWLGDEIVLVPGANGNLQYMRKGTAVMPADISANLVEWGKINPDMTALSNGIQGVNLMSNYVSKPEVNVSFDSLVHVDHCDEGTLKDLEKMVDTKINQFSKQMNYAIKRYK